MILPDTQQRPTIPALDAHRQMRTDMAARQAAFERDHAVRSPQEYQMSLTAVAEA